MARLVLDVMAGEKPAITDFASNKADGPVAGGNPDRPGTLKNSSAVPIVIVQPKAGTQAGGTVREAAGGQ